MASKQRPKRETKKPPKKVPPGKREVEPRFKKR